jgi:hypothetical protein
MLKTNQSLSDCYSGTKVKPYSIEWLWLQRCLVDSFIQLVNSRPNSTTLIPNRDIDFILSYSIDIVNISTLHQNTPCYSDNLGIVCDIDLGKFFSSTYSDITSISPRLLTSRNLKAVNSYTKFVSDQVNIHKIEDKVNILADKVAQKPNDFSHENAAELDHLDLHLTEIMLSGEQQCSGQRIQRQPWSPIQREIARTYSYWKQKGIMSAEELINWEHLNRLRAHTNITDEEHLSLDPTLIYNSCIAARNKCKSCKKKSASICHQFLTERAEFLATKMRTTEEKGLRAMLHAKNSKRIYKNIKELFGKQQVPLTQVDILSNPNDSSSPHTTLTAREDIELHILRRNRKHSLQSLSTPFLSDLSLQHTIDPSSPSNRFDALLDGSILEDSSLDSFSDVERKWIAALHIFRNFFVHLL